MIETIRSEVGRLRRPEYTGENRCLPCTIVNLGLTAVGAVALGLVSPAAGVAFALVAAVAIYLRGYLVPGTPALTKRYFPARVLRWFGKDPAASAADVDAVDPSEIDVEERLTAVGAVEPAGDDLRVAPAFEREWRRAVDDALEAPERRAGELLGLTKPGIEIRSDGCAVTDGGSEAARWRSREALLADLGAAPLLRERIPEWDSLGRATQGRLLAGLRVFLPFCPTCDGTPTFERETVESCCHVAEVIVYDCDGCGARLLELRD
ncbi:hypothetical protein [Halegenticoccus soli]|uniref:hypothetical protein n=1 Tax=Halegenticoccus soli TaxID=1985678 RepID=UPI000C6EC84B|nr:hypothetical protein [Halegenticoccus soli]